MSSDRRAVITGVDLLCPSGETPEALHGGLCRTGPARSSINRIDGTSELAPTAPDAYLAGRNAYPLDRPARLLSAAAQLALDDGGWTAEHSKSREIGLYVGTMFSSAHTISRFDCRSVQEGPAYVSPFDFANTVINAPSGQTAIWHGLRGVNMTVATGGSSGLEAIGSAALAIRTGCVDAVLAGGVEELSPESLRAFDEVGLLSRSGEDPRPFDEKSTGLSLSESAALVLLEELDSARLRGTRVMAEVRGHGSAFDTSRRRDERHSVRSIIRSMRLAIEEAGFGLDDIDVVCASANGMARVDRHEAVAIASVFESRTDVPPVSAVKSLLGEPLGAAGPPQCAAMIVAMRTGIIPVPLDLRRLPGNVVSLAQRAHSSRALFRTCLINSLSYDGHACSLVITSSAA